MAAIWRSASSDVPSYSRERWAPVSCRAPRSDHAAYKPATGQDSLTGKILVVEIVLRAQRMVGGHRHQQGLPEQARDVKGGPGHRQLREDQVLRALVELAHEIARRGLPDVEAQVGMGLVQVAHHIGHEVWAEGGRRAHPDRSGEPRFQGHGEIENALCRIQHLAPAPRDFPPRHGQAHGAPAAFHESLAERVLQRLDLHRQGRLRYSAAFGGLAEMVRLLQRNEVAQLPKREWWNGTRHDASLDTITPK
jgi:hypothetical protein